MKREAFHRHNMENRPVSAFFKRVISIVWKPLVNSGSGGPLHEIQDQDQTRGLGLPWWIQDWSPDLDLKQCLTPGLCGGGGASLCEFKLSSEHCVVK